MKLALKSWVIVIIALLLVATACAQPAPKPAVTPAAPTTAPPPTSAPTVVAPSPPALSAEDAAWNKLVDDAKKEGSVVVYASAISPDSVKTMKDAFKAKYGINVDFLVGSGASNIEKIKTEQATRAYSGDLFYVGPSTAPIAMANKWVQPVKLPAILKEPQAFRVSPYDFDPKGETMITIYEYPPGGMGMVINTNLVPPDKEPKSWSDLLDPWWKGKLIVYSPDTSGPTMDMMAWGSYPEKDAALPLSFWEKLAKQQPVFNRNYRDYHDKVAKGEFAAALPSVSIYAIPMFEAKMPIKQVYQKEGVFVPLMNLMLISNAPHSNAAKLFMNWSFEKEGHEIWTKGNATRGMRKDVPDYTPDYLKAPPGLPLIYPTAEKIVKEQEMIEKNVGAQLFGIK